MSYNRGMNKEEVVHIYGLPWWLRWQREKKKKKCLQCRRPWFDISDWKILRRRKWQHTVVFLPGEFHGQRSLSGYSPWGHKESDTTERLTLSLSVHIYAGILAIKLNETVLSIVMWMALETACMCVNHSVVSIALQPRGL